MDHVVVSVSGILQDKKSEHVKCHIRKHPDTVLISLKETDYLAHRKTITIPFRRYSNTFRFDYN